MASGETQDPSGWGGLDAGPTRPKRSLKLECQELGRGPECRLGPLDLLHAHPLGQTCQKEKDASQGPH